MNKNDLDQAFNKVFVEARDNYIALCPFHSESKPSFFIHQTELVGYCFGCGVGGSVDWLLSRYRNCSLEKARKALGITAKDSLQRARHRVQTAQREAKYYPESWLAPWKKEVHKYVLSRGITGRTVAAAGGLYDSVALRQVFPHRSPEGKLLGVTGRSCVGAEPKWYHYWGYDKGQALYKFKRTDPLRPLVLVEGVFDLLWLYQNGVDNVAAILGSQPTVRQVSEIVRSTETAVLGLDNDGAGRLSTDRAQQAFRHSIKLRYVQWPEGAKDWMDLDRETIHGVLDNTISYVSRQIIRHSGPSSRAVVQQKASSSQLGTRNRKDGYRSRSNREAI